MIATRVLLVLSAIMVAVQAIECDYYFRYHEVFGMGVYAGKIHEPFDIFDAGIGVPVPLELVYGTPELVNYVEGYNSSHALLTLGLGMLLNYNSDMNKVNIRKFMSETPSQFHFLSNGEPSIDVVFEYQSSINVGDQLFVDYGEEWFAERQIPLVDMNSFVIDSQPRNTSFPGCFSRYMHLQQGLDNSHKLIAKRNISANVIVEVARLIVLPMTDPLENYSGPFSDILWWSTDIEHLAVDRQGKVVNNRRKDNFFSEAFLMSGMGPFYGASQNKPGNIKAVIVTTQQNAENQQTVISSRSMVKFMTTRRIVKGEELILSRSAFNDFKKRKILSL
jgi:hypothetical protein